jgi:insulysin
LLIEVDGFSDKAPLFLKTLFSQMKKFSITSQQFQTYRQALLSEYDNGTKDLPVKQAMELVSSIIFRDAPTREERLKALNSVTYEQFAKFTTSVLNKGYIEGFFYGNLNEQTARTLLSSVQEELTLKPYPVSEQKKRQVLLLPNNQGPFMVVRNTDRQGNGVVLCIEEGAFSFDKRASQQILSRGLAEGFFDTLRTKQQTAYFARSWDQEVEGQLLQLFAVQSSSYNPQELLARFELFIEDFVRNIRDKISTERFETMRSMLIQTLETPPENLAVMAQRLNLLAFDYAGDFDWYDQRIAAAKNLTYDHFLTTAQEFIARGDNRRRVAILFEGQVPAEKDFRYEKISKEGICDVGTYSSFR